MNRTVIVCRRADRHSHIHDREFSETRRIVVPDGDLQQVVNNALSGLQFAAGGHFVITVEEPHE